MRRFSAKLSSESLRHLASELDVYAFELELLTMEFVRRLAEHGYAVSDNVFNSTPRRRGIADPAHTNAAIIVDRIGGVITTTLTVSGENVLFIEFGAGVFYNGPAHSSPHDKGDELGYRIGEYRLPESRGVNDTWAYTDGSGKTVVTHGTPAMMPMLKAANSMRQEVISIAREVFGY